MKTTSKKTSNLFVSGVLILTFSNILIKIIGLTLKIPLHHILGDEGMAYYNVAYDLYVWLYMISTAGLPVAVSIMIAESRTKGNFREVKRIFRSTLLLFIIIGLAGMAVMIFGSGLFADLYKIQESNLCIIAIAPTLFFICISSAMRGFFQGYQNMFPTAISQIIEALGKLTIGIALALYAKNAGYGLPTVAAYTILGLTIGVAAGMLFLTVSKLLFKESVYNEEFRIPESDTMEPRSTKKLLGALIAIAIPVTLSSSVMSLTNVIDGIIITRRLYSIGYTEEVVKTIFGNYKTLVIPMFNMPPALIYPISYSIVPLLSSAIAAEDKKRVDMIMSASLRVAALIALPCSLGMSVLAEPILKLLFAAESAKRAAPLLSVLSLSIFFVGMLAITNAILQAHKHERKPIYSIVAGSIVKLVSSYILIGIPSIGMYGAPIGTFLCYLTVMIINFFFIARYIGFMPSVAGVFLRPFLASVICAASALGSFLLLSRLCSSKIAVIVAIAIAAVVYFFTIFMTKAISREDILLLPKGAKLCRIFEKLKLISSES
ncbi:MAG: polysaccharide biosynthesis protein [Firmicutes bacterium]|nr:polysaccharide biosynthesis protein [Bacillota bacterium]